MAEVHPVEGLCCPHPRSSHRSDPRDSIDIRNRCMECEHGSLHLFSPRAPQFGASPQPPELKPGEEWEERACAECSEPAWAWRHRPDSADDSDHHAFVLPNDLPDGLAAAREPSDDARRGVAVDALLSELTRWIRQPVRYDLINDGEVWVWFNNEYPMKLPLSAVLGLWPNAIDSQHAEVNP